MALATTTTRAPKITHCPVCGGLECLCRPRFFAGQLLTEDDLNRLDRYIIAKNKLHNRYLHGWGAVCGLEVICNPCKGFVTVKSGYALSPCGDDIVVCRDETVNVCELIQDCRQKDWECDPAWPRPDPICGDKDEPWILYLCYDEKPSRGVSPIRGASGGGCSCGGSSSCGCSGGSSSCGCGCKETTKHEGKNGCAQTSPKAPPQCEPTITCEGYSFKLRKVQPKLEESDLGEWFNRLQACVKDLVKLQQAVNSLNNANQPANQFLAIRSALIEWMERHAIYNCDLFQRILLVELPPQDPAGGNAAINIVQQNLSPIIFELFRECVCSTLIPPCPAPAEDNCVPIATITLNCKGGCRVVKICNLEHRRSIVTFPILQYFLEGFVKQFQLPELLARLCCADLAIRQEPGAVFLAGPAPGRTEDLLEQIFKDAVAAGGNVTPPSIFSRVREVVRNLPNRLTNP
jgi:hypothetical protein